MDAYEFLKTIPDKSIDLIITDPPYQFDIGTVKNSDGGGFYKNQKKKYIQAIEDSFGLEFNPQSFLLECKRVLKKMNCVICTNKHLLLEYLQFIRENDYSFEILIWAKDNPVPVFNNHFMFDKEYLTLIRESGAPFTRGFPYQDYFTIKRYPTGNKETTHPTEKPIALFRNIIKILSNEGDMVLDPFLGSGTTAIACKQLGRSYIGCDINSEYIQMTENRLAQEIIFPYIEKEHSLFNSL